MVWLLIVIAVVAIIVFAFIHNKEKKEKQQEIAKQKAQQRAERKEKQQQAIKELGPMITEKWAVCVSQFGRLAEINLPPCLIKIEKRDDITIAIRVAKGSEMEALFVVEEQGADKDSYSYTGHHPQTGDMGGIFIKPLDKKEQADNPKAKFSLTVFRMDESHKRDASFYLVLDLVSTDDAEKILAAL